MSDTWIPEPGDIVMIKAEWRNEAHNPPIVGKRALVSQIFATTGELDAGSGGRRIIVLRFSKKTDKNLHQEYFCVSRIPGQYMEAMRGSYAGSAHD